MVDTLVESAVLYDIVDKWSRAMIDAIYADGVPTTTTIQENAKKFHDFVLQDRGVLNKYQIENNSLCGIIYYTYRQI